MKLKRWVGFAVTAAAAVLLLSACTSSEQKNTENTQETDSVSVGTVVNHESVSQEQTSASQEVAGVPENGADLSGSSSLAGQTEGGSTTGGSYASGTDTNPEAPQEQGTPVEEEPSGTVISDEDADAAEEENAEQSGSDATEDSQEASWSGTYMSDDETLTVTQTDDTTLSIAFGQSGISGTASIEGMKAVYKGDDHHDVVLNLTGDVIDVTVSSEEDFDASQSPLIGSYVRVED